MRVFLTFVLLTLITTRSALAAEAPQKCALLIAVSQYENDEMNDPQLQFPESDARALGELLSWAGYQVDYLLGRAATQSSIRKKFADLTQNDRKDRVSVVAMFGHGLEIGIPGNSVDGATEAAFCPFNTIMRTALDGQGRAILSEDGHATIEPDPDSMVRLSELLSVLRSVNTGKNVIFADCGHKIFSKTQGRVFGSSFKATELPQNTTIFFGCSPKELSLEHPSWGQGAFANCLLQEMQNIYATSNVTTGALADRMRRNMPQLVSTAMDGKQQTPRVFSINSIDLQFSKLSGRHAFVGKLSGEGRELVPGMVFHWCPLGSCMMGSPPAEVGRHKNEDQVEVSLTGFWMGETEVSQGQWEMLMKSAPWKGKSNLHTGRLQISMIVKEGPEYAASYISHGDLGDGTIQSDSATDFCRRLTERERKAGRLPVGWKYALPSEAQWEYACRAGTTTQFSFGDDETLLSKYGWWGSKYGYGSARPDPYPNRVGVKAPNAWGLCDMHGNVWEWCSDWFADRLPGGRDPIVLTKASMRVCRGGCWLLDRPSCRSAIRSGSSPENRNSVTGFRVVAVPSRE